MLHSAEVRPRFERWIGAPSNLDRCTRCGRPRGVHDADWSCPGPPSARVADTALCAGALLAASGIVLRFADVFASPRIPAAMFLAGVVLLMAGWSLLFTRS